MKRLKLYTYKVSNRLEFACQIIFKILWQVPYSILEAGSDQPDENCINIYYGAAQPIKGNNPYSFRIVPSGLIFRSDIEKIDLPVKWHADVPILFGSEGQCDLGFDIFSAVFFMASRYEEYLPFSPDGFGRFPEVESLSGKNDFTHLPVVHIWAKIFAQKLCKRFPDFIIPKRIPKVIFTYDIDVAFAYRGRSIGIHLLSLGKDLLKGNWQNIQQKLATGFGKKNDPTDTYNIMICNNLQKIFFFLLATKRNNYDRNIPPGSEAIRQLIQKLKTANMHIGIHPSYFSSEKTNLIPEEKKYLENIVNDAVESSRQHFLRFRLPETYRALYKAGIRNEYSMQYPEMPGFRSGMCLPFPFFDVEADTLTDLMIHPGCIMETTFRDDLHLPAYQSWEWYLSMWEQVKCAGGEFICIWHNDSLQSYKSERHPLAFRSVHENLINIIRRDLEDISKNG